MPDPRIHDEINEKIFGKPYSEVSKWIDGSYDGHNGRTHWVNRHYLMAILTHFNPTDFPDREKRERLIQVARLHIIYDWAFYYHRVVLPLFREDVIRELRSEGILIE